MKRIWLIMTVLFMVIGIGAVTYLMIERKKEADIEMQMLRKEGEEVSKERNKLMEKWNSVSDRHVDAVFDNVKTR